MNRRRIDMLIEQGRAAARSKAPRNPPEEYRGSMDWFHWQTGYDAQAAEMNPQLGEVSDEISHIVQWVELSMRAQNFGLQVRFSSKGFSLHHKERSPAMAEWARGGEQIGGTYATLFDLRAAISDYVAAERGRGRRF